MKIWAISCGIPTVPGLNMLAIVGIAETNTI